ncbi:MAG: hypothetical protein JJ896_10820 [Rhodothermales bacterium]|nr:hypothetical protein [Rhodothermales bacterium]MBO6780134.1 hypothetical protein [Rhodothermales bacterium]
MSLVLDDAAILAARGPRAKLDPERPYAVHSESETLADGTRAQVLTVFLTNRECPFRCLMCDLWTHTLTHTPAPGQVVRQIEWAMGQAPGFDHIKLYNAGSFFDRKAFPPEDLPEVAQVLGRTRRVIVENHPALCGDAVFEFAARIHGRLEVALGLETAHPGVLERLNKRMTVADFEHAARRLRRGGVDVRTFVLVRPPFMNEDEGIHWAVESARVAWQAGAQVVTLIPTRAGNGIMDQLQRNGHFTPPTVKALESAVEQTLAQTPPGVRVFGDLWDVDRLEGCARCAQNRQARIARMNRDQRVPTPVLCDAC